jgi:hypothetical protein
MIVSDRSPGFSVHPSIPNAWVWNPVNMAFEKACREMGVTEGKIAISGGTAVFGLFLRIAFDAFHLSGAAKLVLPGGRPVFAEVPAKTPEEVLSEHGLRPMPVQMLDREAEVTLVTWKREGL